MKHECMAIKQECVLGVTYTINRPDWIDGNDFVDTRHLIKAFFMPGYDKKPLHKFKLNSNKAYSMVYYTQEKAFSIQQQGDCNATDLM